ncbi:MAG: hypothetical protein KF780_12240 [Sphingomonas sp.]|nr:hypothetical protein [Sphingomonas sp.]
MSRTRNLPGRLPLAGGAVALLATLTHWFPNMNRLPYEDAVPTIAAMLAIAAAVTILLRPVARSWAGAGLMSGIVAVYCLYLPAPVAALSASALVQGLLLAAGAVLAVLVARRVPRDAAVAAEINRKINLLLVSVAIGMSAAAAIQQVRAEADRPDPHAAFAPFAGQAEADSPDVWHIVFDRYAGSETLRGVYGYDNEPFLDALRARGFVVGTGNHANYQRTAHSLASALNGDYLDTLADDVAQQNDWVPLYRAMTGNRALRFFRAQGYETVFAGSWWNPTRRSALADRNVNYRALPELARVVLDESAPGFVLRQAGLPFGDTRTDQCRRAPRKFAALRELAGEGGRKYVFAHFLVPHPPFVLNADGSCRSLAAASAASRRDNYVAQLQYANREALRLIDAIRAGPRPAVIVIHADEGPWPAPHVGDERYIGRDPVSVDWVELDTARLREKMGILMAVRPADARPLAVPASPVNVYPAILRSYFGGSLPDRPDRYLVFEGDGALYRFRDVAGRLSGDGPAARPESGPPAQLE